ncbi:galactosylceramide sulfotransferase-like [Diadema antillarum]|uniref:galactosylceramide sulfotransferase-like n=1 Tax=Diadema antillarum TaxID=105358 RepID=UPI003A8ADA99
MATNTSPPSILTSLFLPVCAVVIICCFFLDADRQPTLLSHQYPKVRPFLSERTIYATMSKGNQSLCPTGPISVTSVMLIADSVRNESDVPHQATCQPLQRAVYVKTHKTGSTTLASIFERYAYLHSLDVAVPPRSHILSSDDLFLTSMVIKFKSRKRKDFDMLVNHVRYNRRQMDIAVPHAKYISIIRHPVKQFESFFGYFEIAERLKINASNPLEAFMSNVKVYNANDSFLWTRFRNGQLYDFGFDHRYDENFTRIREKIEELAREIDLVMINEYFDESLILLRKLMCWNYTDILYVSNAVRSKSHRYPLTEKTAERIRSWNAGDIMLYDYFNTTFWKKVREYGENFHQDLAYFRALEQSVMDDCIMKNETDNRDIREDKFITKQNATKFCEDLLRADILYTRLIRKTMTTRFKRHKRRH